MHFTCKAIFITHKVKKDWIYLFNLNIKCPQGKELTNGKTKQNKTSFEKQLSWFFNSVMLHWENCECFWERVNFFLEVFIQQLTNLAPLHVWQVHFLMRLQDGNISWSHFKLTDLWYFLLLVSAASMDPELGFAGKLWCAVSFGQQSLNKPRWFSLIPLNDDISCFQSLGSSCSVAALHHGKD